MSGTYDAPLVGPGSELQLTIDGRAVPHAEVVAAGRARAAAPEREPAPVVPLPHAAAQQPRLVDL